MIDELKKEINDDQEILSILPQNNVNNRKKYISKVKELLSKYTSMQNDVYSYISTKNSLLKQKYNKGYHDVHKQEIDDLYEKLGYFNKYQDAYEILGLDKLFYNLHKYYDNDLNFYNDNIYKILDIFEKANVKLSIDDFNFNDSVKEYMLVLLNERMNGNLHSPLVKNTFEDLFWKCHNMMRYILLNFKHLYFQNEKKFREYVETIQKSILADYEGNYDVLLQKYNSLIIEQNKTYQESVGIYYQRFVDKDIQVKDYEDEKIKKLMADFIDEEHTSKDMFEKFYYSLKEEKFIYDYKLILDEMNKLYQDKDTYKNLVNGVKKEIASLEKSIIKKRKKIKSKCIFKKKDKDVILSNEIENILEELDTKYDELDDSRYKEKITTMDKPSICDFFLLGKSFLFLQKIAKEHEEVNVQNTLEDISRNILNPYNLINKNVGYESIDNIGLIIYDNYKLLGFKLVAEELSYENVESLIKTIDNILIYFNLKNVGLSLDEMDFILKSDEIIKKVSSG